MTAKEYLSRVKDQIRTERRLVLQIESLRNKATSLEIHLTGMPKGSLSYTAADYIADITDLQKELAVAIEEERRAYKEILETLNKLEDPKLKNLLITRYLMLKPWSEIAAELDIPERWAYRLHGKALKEVEKILKLAILSH